MHETLKFTFQGHFLPIKLDHSMVLEIKHKNDANVGEMNVFKMYMIAHGKLFALFPHLQLTCNVDWTLHPGMSG